LKTGATIDYYRREVMNKHGFAPGSMYGDDTPKKAKPKCSKCGKSFRGEQGVRDHLRDYHKTPNVQIEGLAATKRERSPESSITAGREENAYRPVPLERRVRRVLPQTLQLV